MENGKYVEEYHIFKVEYVFSNYRFSISGPINSNANGFSNHNDIDFSIFDIGSLSRQAVSLNAGFWIKSDINYFCFSCENGIEKGASYSNLYNFGCRSNSYHHSNQKSKVKI